MQKEEEFDLAEFLENAEAEELQIDVNNLESQIMDSAKANYLLGVIKRRQEEIDEINKFCDAEIERKSNIINEFRAKKTKTLNSEIEYLKNILEKYAIGELENSKKKSVSLPFGVLAFRKSTDKIELNNNTLEYLKEKGLNDFIKIEEKVDKASIKKNLKETDGKIHLNGVDATDFIHIIPGEVTFSVKIKTEE